MPTRPGSSTCLADDAVRDPRGIFTDLAMPAVAAIAGPMCINTRLRTRRSAPREALDPGEGEAMLGQALHTVPPWELSSPCGAGWASTACLLSLRTLLVFPEATV